MSAEKNSIEAIMAQLQHLQNIVGAMVAGDSGLDFSGMMGNDDDVIPVVPIGGGIENFDLKLVDGTKKIGKGVVCIGRQHYLVAESEFQGDGQYRLKVDLNSMSVTVGKGDGFAKPEDEVSYIPLYEVTNEMIAEDYRSNFCVVARE